MIRAAIDEKLIIVWPAIHGISASAARSKTWMRVLIPADLLDKVSHVIKRDPFRSADRFLLSEAGLGA